MSASVGTPEATENPLALADATTTLWPPDAIPTALRVKADEGTWIDAQRLGAAAADRWFAKARVDRQNKLGRVFELGTENSAQELRIRPFPAHGQIHIAYDALLPTSFAQGIHRLGLPMPEGGATISPQFDFPRGGALITASNESRGGSTPNAHFEWVWRSSTIGVEAELITTANGLKGYLAWRVRASEPLFLRPKHASVVILLDQSRSVEKSQFATFLQGAASWIAAYENAQIEILSLDRKVWAHTTQFVDRDAAAALLGAIPTARSYGSNVEVALLEAVTRLKTQAPTQNRAILLLTDAEYPMNLPLPKLGRLLRESGTQLFVGVSNRNEFCSQFELLNRLCHDTNGVAMLVETPKDIGELATPKHVARGQLRPQPHDCAGPIVLDHLLAGFALQAQEQIDPSLLFRHSQTANWGELSYERGGSQQTRRIRVDELLSRLEREWQPGLERNSVYVAAFRGNLRALSYPLAPRECSAFGVSSYCVGRQSGSSTGSHACHVFQLRRDLLAVFEADWQRLSRQCGVKGTASATVKIYATEIEDVNRVSAPNSPPTVVDCLSEGLWAFEGPEPERDDFCFSGEVQLTYDQ